MLKKVNKLKRWTYGVRKEPSEYGPYICDIFFSLKQIDYHTCCESEKDAEKLGKHWIDFLEKYDKIFKYEPSKYKNWLDWYSIAHAKVMNFGNKGPKLPDRVKECQGLYTREKSDLFIDDLTPKELRMIADHLEWKENMKKAGVKT